MYFKTFSKKASTMFNYLTQINFHSHNQISRNFAILCGVTASFGFLKGGIIYIGTVTTEFSKPVFDH